jgi:hypothetical protein
MKSALRAILRAAATSVVWCWWTVRGSTLEIFYDLTFGHLAS